MRLAPERPLPDHPFLPGTGQPRPPEPHWPPPPADPAAWPDCLDLRYGLDLFSRGFFWEAHEAWEHLWRAMPDGCRERPVLQGLIQLAAALLKAEQGVDAGARRLVARSLANLAGEGTVLGFDLASLRNGVHRWRAGGQAPDLVAIRTG